MRMSSEYFSGLDFLAQRRYFLKLKLDGDTFPDPYDIGESTWVDDVTKWPNLQFGDIYTYLIDTKGQYTKESLKAYKSLEGYNYFYNGYVRTVFYFRRVRFACLKAVVNPSQKTLGTGHEAWVLIDQTDASIKTAHCKCMAG